MAKMSEYKLHNLFDKLAGFDRDRIIASVMATSGLSKETATNYYYQWKKIFVNSNDCVPKEVKKELVKQVAEKLPVVEVIAEPDAIIAAAREMHETSTEPIREFTAEEKEEVAAIESAQAEEPFEISVILKGKIFTYQLTKDGAIIIDGYTDSITTASISEQLDALEAWNKYFGRLSA